MQRNMEKIDVRGLSMDYAVGDAETLARMRSLPLMEPFSEPVCAFLQAVSGALLSDAEARAYPDVVTLAFWLRRASVENLKKRFAQEREGEYVLGRGVVFHVAPSNVPVNYAYSLAAGLLCGNANVVRLPSKEFPPVEIINRAIAAALERRELADYVALVRYGHDREVNDALSGLADVRVVWGGDNTIAELRKSPLRPRATELTFADRCSLAVIDSDTYMETGDKAKIASNFYNDTYLTDQNACTSPRVVAWLGKRRAEAKELFWETLHGLVEKRYALAGVQAVNKLTSAFLLAEAEDGARLEKMPDNLIVRLRVQRLTADLMEYKDNSGFFLEYDCEDVMELAAFCDDVRCQTLAYLGDREAFVPLLASGIRGVDRIVPIGRTMDFDLIWDGYNLYERLTRRVAWIK